MKTRSRIPPKAADHVLRELRRGRSLGDICRDDGVPHIGTVMRWVAQDRDGFAARYREARQIGHGNSGHIAYSAALADRIIEQVMKGRSVVDICREPNMPNHTTVWRWAVEDREGFAARYRRARRIGHGHSGQVPYNIEIAEKILGELMKGRPLSEICAEPGMPANASVRNWVKDDRDGFAERYRQARECGLHMIADEMLDIVDNRDHDWIAQLGPDGDIAFVLDPQRVRRAELRCNTRQALLSRLLPRVFGKQPNIIPRIRRRSRSG